MTDQITCICCKYGLGTPHLDSIKNEVIHIQPVATLVPKPHNVSIACSNPNIILSNKDLELEKKFELLLKSNIEENINIGIKPIILKLSFVRELDSSREEFEKNPYFINKDSCPSFALFFMFLDDYITYVPEYNYNITLASDVEFIKSKYEEGINLADLLNNHLIINNLGAII